MLQLPLLYALFAVLAAALAIVAVWSRRSLGARVGSVGLLVITLAAGYVAYVDLLSRPKPAMLEYRRAGMAEADVLAAALRQNEGIYLWLKLPDKPYPPPLEYNHPSLAI